VDSNRKRKLVDVLTSSVLRKLPQKNVPGGVRSVIEEVVRKFDFGDGPDTVQLAVVAWMRHTGGMTEEVGGELIRVDVTPDDVEPLFRLLARCESILRSPAIEFDDDHEIANTVDELSKDIACLLAGDQTRL
jgi:hypothetical protein